MRLPLLITLLLTALPAVGQKLRIPPVDYPVLPASATSAAETGLNPRKKGA